MPIAPRNVFIKWVTLLIEAAVLVFLTVWVARNYIATLIAKKPTIHNLTLAEKYSPGDAFYPHVEGRLFEYSLTDPDPSLAVKKLRRAARLNPYQPQTWLDLGAGLEMQGEIAAAERGLRWADFLAPRQPEFQWSIANFFLLHGNIDEAFKHFRMILASSEPGYSGIIFNTAWKASGDANKILQELVPLGYAQFQYLYFLIGTHRYPEADAVWDRIVSDQGKFDPQLASGYLETLIALHRPADAYQVWEVLRSKGIISPTLEETPQNLIENGDFEEKPLNLGFDWRTPPMGGVYIGLDSTTFHSPAHSMLVQFDGKVNYDFQNVYQPVLVKPDTSYQLRAFMKTNGITTDSGVRLEVKDAYDTRSLDVATQNLVGTTPGWILVSQDFRTGPKTHLIAVVLRRYPSQKFDNLIAGKAWLDDVTLTETTGRR
ncbi:MAG: carbohydrate binding domain-containing protein [Terriglobia bacterium]